MVFWLLKFHITLKLNCGQNHIKFSNFIKLFQTFHLAKYLVFGATVRFILIKVKWFSVLFCKFFVWCYTNWKKSKHSFGSIFSNQLEGISSCFTAKSRYYIIRLQKQALGGVLSKKVFLKISQNSQENTCARLSFLIKLQVLGLRPAALLKKKLWYRRFPVNLAKFLRTTFLQNTVGRLLPDIPERYF